MFDLCQPVLVPAGADDEGDQLALLEPPQGQLGTLAQEAEHLVQGERTFSRHGHECWWGGRPITKEEKVK